MSRKRQNVLRDDELLEYLNELDDDNDVDEPSELEENSESDYAPPNAGMSIQNFLILCL